jgi:hypothetical protein
VLEVPQALPRANPQPSDDTDQTAQDGGSQAPDEVGSIQVGSIEDYQYEEDAALMGAYGVPILLGPVGINPFRVSASGQAFSLVSCRSSNDHLGAG